MGTCTGAIRGIRLQIVNIFLQHLLAVKYFGCNRCDIGMQDYMHGLIFKHGGILYLTDLWWRILPYVASRSLLANDSFKNELLSSSSFLMLIGLNNMWPATSKTIAVRLYSFEFVFVTLFSKHQLYRECSIERGSENSFERMWGILNGFCISGRRSCSKRAPYWFHIFEPFVFNKLKAFMKINMKWWNVYLMYI